MKRRLVMLAALAAATVRAADPRPQREAERLALLSRGEAALAQLDPVQALAAFEQAARIAHSADTEIAIVRSHMQAGEFRRALSFAAHTAGAHIDESAGAALYAWLLHAGGQEAVARKLLAQALERAPGEPLLAQVAFQLRNPWPVATGALLRAPTRFAPYGESKGVPGGAAVVASATLAAGGGKALVPAAALARGARYWVRNGLGRLAEARPDPAPPAHGLALLRMAIPLAGPALQADAERAGRAVLAGGADEAGLHPGPGRRGVGLRRELHRVGDAAREGRCADGLQRRAGQWDCHPLLRQAFGDDLFAVAPAGPGRPAAPDWIYEAALGQTLQLLRAGGARA